MKYTELVINGETASKITISGMVKAFYNLKTVKSYGGYILTYRIHNDISYIGVKPAIMEGQRNNHYDLIAGPETKVFLTGGINTNGEISLLFKISKIELNDKKKSELRELYLNFSYLLIDNGFKGPGTLDWITKNILGESKLFSNVPKTIYDLQI